MNVGELQTLLNLFPENMEIVVSEKFHEFRVPNIGKISVIISKEGLDKYYFEDDGELVEGEQIEEVLLIN